MSRFFVVVFEDADTVKTDSYISTQAFVDANVKDLDPDVSIHQVEEIEPPKFAKNSNQKTLTFRLL